MAKRAAARSREKTERPRAIRDDESYSLREFMRITGIGDAGLRRIRREAPKREVVVVRYEGNRGFVRGEDWNKYLAKAPGVRP